VNVIAIANQSVAQMNVARDWEMNASARTRKKKQ